MKLALDTNRYVDLMRGDAEVRALVEAARTVLVPFVVVAELRAGFAVGTAGRANERFLQRFLAKDWGGSGVGDGCDDASLRGVVSAVAAAGDAGAYE